MVFHIKFNYNSNFLGFYSQYRAYFLHFIQFCHPSEFCTVSDGTSTVTRICIDSHGTKHICRNHREWEFLNSSICDHFFYSVYYVSRAYTVKKG